MVDICDLFELARGTIIGREHVRLGKNNHDSLSIQSNNDAMVSVVCDGCSAGEHSEMGANLGARLLTEAIMVNIKRHGNLKNIPGDFDWPYFWERIRQDVLAQLRILANGMGQSLTQTITDYFLFSTVGFLVASDQTIIFSIGDGIYAVNGQIKTIGPFHGNEPPYLVYGLIRSSVEDRDPALIRFQIQQTLPTAELDSVLIGTDGVTDLINSAQKKMPGKTELVGPLEQFWSEDDFFSNPDGVRRKLFLVNREVILPNWDEKYLRREFGLLLDDTTLVVVRRKPNRP